MQIRRAATDDAQEISGLIVPLATEYIAHEFSNEGEAHLLECMYAEAIERFMQSGYRYHVAEESGAIAGVIGVRDNRHIFHLFVAKSHQGQGIARKLWELARDDCLAKGNTGEFTVNSSNYAVAVYRKFGFSESGPPVTEHEVTAVPMKLIMAGDSRPGIGMP